MSCKPGEKDLQPRVPGLVSKGNPGFAQQRDPGLLSKNLHYRPGFLKKYIF